MLNSLYNTPSLKIKLEIKLSSQYFESNEKINEYIRDSNYGESQKPPLLFGVNIEEFSEESYKYSIRFNVSGKSSITNPNKFTPVSKYYP